MLQYLKDTENLAVKSPFIFLSVHIIKAMEAMEAMEAMKKLITGQKTMFQLPIVIFSKKLSS